MAQWIEWSTHDRKVPGSNLTSDTWVFSSVFNPPSLDLLPRTTVKFKKKFFLINNNNKIK